MMLPSTKAARACWAGEGCGRVALTAVARAAVIAAGAYAAGVRGDALVRAAVGGSVAIEALVLAYTYVTKDGDG